MSQEQQEPYMELRLGKLKLALKPERPESKHSLSVLEIKKEEAAPVRLSLDEAKFLRDYLEMMIDKHWNA